MKVFSLLAIAILFLSYSQAEAACGKFVVVKGDVQVDFAKEKRTDHAHVGTEVCAGDSIKSGKDSRAKIVMVDNNELNISPDTVMKIAAYEFKSEDQHKKVLLDVLRGKVRSTVKQKYDGQANTYQVKTKAAVAGVRGTDFIASFDPKMGRLEVVTFRGRVEVGPMGRDGRVIPDVAVIAGQMTEVMMGKAAQVPRAVPTEELKVMDSNSQAAAPSPKASDNASNTPSRNDGDKKKDDRHPQSIGGSGMWQPSDGPGNDDGPKLIPMPTPPPVVMNPSPMPTPVPIPPPPQRGLSNVNVRVIGP